MELGDLVYLEGEERMSQIYLSGFSLEWTDGHCSYQLRYNLRVKFKAGSGISDIGGTFKARHPAGDRTDEVLSHQHVCAIILISPQEIIRESIHVRIGGENLEDFQILVGEIK